MRSIPRRSGSAVFRQQRNSAYLKLNLGVERRAFVGGLVSHVVPSGSAAPGEVMGLQIVPHNARGMREPGGRNLLEADLGHSRALVAS